MTANATQLEGRYLPDTGEKVRMLTLDQVDGRTLAVRRVKNTEAQLGTDLGECLSEAQRALIRRASVLSAVLEDSEARWAKGDPLPLDEYLATVNTLRRVLSSLGLERRAKPVDGLPPLLDGR